MRTQAGHMHTGNNSQATGRAQATQEQQQPGYRLGTRSTTATTARPQAVHAAQGQQQPGHGLYTQYTGSSSQGTGSAHSIRVTTARPQAGHRQYKGNSSQGTGCTRSSPATPADEPRIASFSGSCCSAHDTVVPSPWPA